jgi:hypothetical protein
VPVREEGRRGRARSGRRGSCGPVAIAALLLTLAAAIAVPGPAAAARWNWSGSAAMNHKSLRGVSHPEEIATAGSTVEWSLKATVDASDKVTINAKLCSGCHGLFMDQASMELRWREPANVEAGRINVPFGDFYLRHDPASQLLPSKPLPYEMGHMLRYQSNEFNLGVLPMPYTDSGLSVFGDHWFGQAVQLWYAVYAVNGFRSGVARDFTFKDQTNISGYTDNNRDTSWGTHVSFSHGDATLGASYLSGAYDPAAAYRYEVWGVDASMAIRALRLRYEYLERATDVDADGARDVLRKKGFYLQAELATGEHVTLVGRLDGLLRKGPAIGTDNDENSGIIRGTAGVSIAPTADSALRLDYERWRFTDFDHVNVIHSAIVVAY